MLSGWSLAMFKDSDGVFFSLCILSAEQLSYAFSWQHFSPLKSDDQGRISVKEEKKKKKPFW